MTVGKKEWQQSCGLSKSSILLDVEVSLGWTQMDTQTPAYRCYMQYSYKNGIKFIEIDTRISMLLLYFRRIIKIIIKRECEVSLL